MSYLYDCDVRSSFAVRWLARVCDGGIFMMEKINKWHFSETENKSCTEALRLTALGRAEHPRNLLYTWLCHWQARSMHRLSDATLHGW